MGPEHANFDIPTLCCSFLFIIASKIYLNAKQKKDVSINMSGCHSF